MVSCYIGFNRLSWFLIVLSFALSSPSCRRQGAKQNRCACMSDEAAIRRYHELYYYRRHQTWLANKWLGIPTEQNPNDVWIIQEIIVETRPDLIIECGAMHGGSAALWASILREINPSGKVLSIDIKDRFTRARRLDVVRSHVEFIIGSSVDPKIVGWIKERAAGKRVLVILDSDHRKRHVLKELQSYWEMVQVGGYIVVQDTNVNGHPVRPDFGPGPMEAVEEFLKTNDRFVSDPKRERMMFTMHPKGFLKRVKS